MAAVTAKSVQQPVNVILALIGLLLLVWLLWQFRPQSSAAPVLQHATMLSEPVSLGEFRLQDQYGQSVQAADLQGRWHLLSYGYSYCPDVCPLTLAKLAYLQQLALETEYPQLDLLFYSIDPGRDSATELKRYLQHFAADIRGLRPDPQATELAKPFEQALSLRFNVSQNQQDTTDYNVSHGLTLYLLNQDARLQAVFFPVKRPDRAVPEFDADILLQDYLAIRRYLATEPK